MDLDNNLNDELSNKLEEQNLENFPQKKVNEKKLDLLNIINRDDFGTIASSLNIYIIKTDVSGNFNFCNQTFLDKFNWIFNGANLKDRNVFQTIFTEDFQKAKEIVDNCLKYPGIPFKKELRIHFFNKDLNTFLWSFLCIKDSKSANDEILYMGLEAPIITNSEKELIETKHLLEKIAWSIPSFIYVFDVYKNVNVYSNRLITEFLGYTVEQIKYLGPDLFANIMHPDDLEIITEHHHKFFTTGPNIINSLVYRMKHSDGSWHWIKSRDTLFVEDIPNEILQIIGSAEDITEQIAIKENLDETYRRWKITLDGIKDSIFLLDPEGNILQTNHSSLKLLGLSKENILGHKCYEIVHKTDCRIENCPFLRMQQSKKRETMLLQVGDKWFEVLIDPILDKDNNITSAVHIITDITENKKAEELIKRKSKQLEELNAEKDKLFSIIAHDFKGPFHGFLGLTRILSEGVSKFTSEEIVTIAQNMNKSAINLFGLLQNLLEWARLQSGQVTYNPIQIVLSGIVSQAIEHTTKLANQKLINIENEIDKSQKVFADEIMLLSLLLNLLVNAIKFTNQKGKIVIKSRINQDSMVEVAIIDNGIGMPESLCNKLFNLGEKVGRAGTEGEESTGLGLLICKEFVENNGGKIWVESQEGVGSTFYFTLKSVN